jgi:glutathione synthase/RimK-type ligase-like ATP-grasp enzyme
MARGHWQIQQAKSATKRSYGRSETLTVQDAPSAVVELALRAARLVGDGFYGLDIKEVDGRLLVMEINDNPSVQAGCEDALLKDELYNTIMQVFYSRLERRGSLKP